jgi:DNA repair/transcription protein MET18/MMS19
VEYLCARLKNEESIPTYHAGLEEVGDSLSTLASWKTFPPGDAALVASSVFSLVRGQSNVFISQRPDPRLAHYSLIAFLFEKFKRQLERDLGFPTLITGIADLAELEKNPSCLKVLFQLYAQISREWDLQPAESSKLWELFVRYYPITLGGTALDPNKPSPEELKDLLLKCFISSDRYAEDAFTLLLSNLDTDQAANKKVSDCLDWIPVPANMM